MSIALAILLAAFCVQGLVKFGVGFLVPVRDAEPTATNVVAAEGSQRSEVDPGRGRCGVVSGA